MSQYQIGDDLYDLDITDWPNVDVSTAQRALGCKSGEIMERIGEMDVDAIQVVIWILRRRKEPTLRVDAVTFTLAEFLANTRLTEAEIRMGWAGAVSDAARVVKKDPTLDEDEIIAAGRAQIVGMMTDEQKARLLDADGDLIPEAAAVPLDSPTPSSETSPS